MAPNDDEQNDSGGRRRDSTRQDANDGRKVASDRSRLLDGELSARRDANGNSGGRRGRNSSSGRGSRRGRDDEHERGRYDDQEDEDEDGGRRDGHDDEYDDEDDDSGHRGDGRGSRGRRHRKRRRGRRERTEKSEEQDRDSDANSEDDNDGDHSDDGSGRRKRSKVSDRDGYNRSRKHGRGSSDVDDRTRSRGKGFSMEDERGGRKRDDDYHDNHPRDRTQDDRFGGGPRNAPHNRGGGGPRFDMDRRGSDSRGGPPPHHHHRDAYFRGPPFPPHHPDHQHPPHWGPTRWPPFHPDDDRARHPPPHQGNSHVPHWDDHHYHGRHDRPMNAPPGRRGNEDFPHDFSSQGEDQRRIRNHGSSTARLPEYRIVKQPIDEKLPGDCLQNDPRTSGQSSSRSSNRSNESLDPASTLVRPDLRIVVGSPNAKHHSHPLKHDDIVMVPELFGPEDDWKMYYDIINEITEIQKRDREKSSQTDRSHSKEVSSVYEWIACHDGAHLMMKKPDESPTFQKVVARLCEYFRISPDNVSTRLHWYKDSADWEPFHHDSAAFNSRLAKNQNMSVSASFGARRELAFVRATEDSQSDERSKIYIPQWNNGVCSFGRDANIRWKHGINALPPAEQDGKGRISIILWGLAENVQEEEGSPMLLNSDGPNSRGQNSRRRDRGDRRGGGRDNRPDRGDDGRRGRRGRDSEGEVGRRDSGRDMSDGQHGDHSVAHADSKRENTKGDDDDGYRKNDELQRVPTRDEKQEGTSSRDARDGREDRGE